jgi:hypothetical protein
VPDLASESPAAVVEAARVVRRESTRFSVVGVVTCLLTTAAGTRVTDLAWRSLLLVLLIVLGVLCIRTVRAWGALRRARRAA